MRGWFCVAFIGPIVKEKSRNIDRLFAIWQAVHPNSYVTPQANTAGTYTEAPGFVEDINTRKAVFWIILEIIADLSSFDAFSL